MMDAKWTEVVTVKSELPVKGDKMLAKKVDKSYAKVFTQETIGLNGVFWFYGSLNPTHEKRKIRQNLRYFRFPPHLEYRKLIDLANHLAIFV